MTSDGVLVSVTRGASCKKYKTGGGVSSKDCKFMNYYTLENGLNVKIATKYA